jgi:hypothetical protein
MFNLLLLIIHFRSTLFSLFNADKSYLKLALHQTSPPLLDITCPYTGNTVPRYSVHHHPTSQGISTKDHPIIGIGSITAPHIVQVYLAIHEGELHQKGYSPTSLPQKDTIESNTPWSHSVPP